MDSRVELSLKKITFADIFFRRFVFSLLVCAVLWYGVSLIWHVLSANGLTPLEFALMILFSASFVMLTIGFVNALIGFCIKLFAKDPLAYAAPILPLKSNITSRTSQLANVKTALLFPIYKEDIQKIASYISDLLNQLNQNPNFTVFILSDTPEGDLVKTELAEFEKLQQVFGSLVRYRRRTDNTGKKAGNIWDFVQSYSQDFEHMIIFDADSQMSARLIEDLVSAISENPRVAIISTLPMIIGAKTFFARMLQFGHRLCGEILSLGNSFWQLGSANYFGHNAIIRIAPFKQHCKLPSLSGEPPFGGDVLSHDFVEAAYLRRAGWEVWAWPVRTESFEQTPQNILDYIKRDRRWCQGNLQHSRIIFEAGLKPISRMHLGLGILSFLSSLLWFAALTLSATKLSIEALTPTNYFPEPHSLFPKWPEFRTGEVILLLASVLFLLFAPKFMGLIIMLKERNYKEEFKSLSSLLVTFFKELVFSALMAPTLMIYHTLFVLQVLSQRTVLWGNQNRDAVNIPIWQAIRMLKVQVFFGLLLLLVVAAIIPDSWIWFAPIVLGLLLSIPLAIISSRPR